MFQRGYPTKTYILHFRDLGVVSQSSQCPATPTYCVLTVPAADPCAHSKHERPCGARLQAEATVQSWDLTTLRLVELSTIAFILLLLPQLWKNAAALAASNAEALSGLAWEVCQLRAICAGHRICACVKRTQTQSPAFWQINLSDSTESVYSHEAWSTVFHALKTLGTFLLSCL